MSRDGNPTDCMVWGAGEPNIRVWEMKHWGEGRTFTVILIWLLLKWMLASSMLGQWKCIVSAQDLLERFALSSSKSSWDVCYSRAQPLPTWDGAVPNQRTFNTEISILSCLYWGPEEPCNRFQWKLLLQLIQRSLYCKHCNRIFYIKKASKFFLH